MNSVFMIFIVMAAVLVITSGVWVAIALISAISTIRRSESTAAAQTDDGNDLKTNIPGK
jgi:uncharacterized membrane protein